MHWIAFQFVILGLTMIISSPQELNSNLRVTEYGELYAFVGETIIFTCRTERSNLIGWSSKEYIGVNRLDFASVEPNGTTRRPTESGAVARLISSSRVNGTAIVVSQLQITVQSVYQIASVTCHNIGIDTVNTSSFRVADNTSITCDVPAICPGQKISCACTTAHSNTIAWSSDQLTGEGGAKLVFDMNEPLLTRQNVSNMDTYLHAVLSGAFNENGVIILKSELSFVLLSTSFDIILTCGNDDRQNSYSLILPIYEECATTTTTSVDLATTTDESTNTTSNGMPFNPSDVAGVFVSTIVLLSGVVVIILLVLMMYCSCWRLKSSRNGKHIHRKLKVTRGGGDTTWKNRIQNDCECTTKELPSYNGPGLESQSIQETEIQDNCETERELEKQPLDGDSVVAVAESETGRVSPHISCTRGMGNMEATSSSPIKFRRSSSLSRGMGNMEPTFRYSPIEFRRSSSLSRGMGNMEATLSSPIEFKTSVSSIEEIEEDERALKEQIQELKEQVEEKNQLIKRKENELEQQQKAKQQKREIIKYPVQASAANDSMEANVVRKRDRLLVARTGNKRPSIPNTGYVTILQ